jgi:FliI/YscN family ATPase
VSTSCPRKLSPCLRVTGAITAVQGSSITARLPIGSIGDICNIETRHGNSTSAQIAAFEGSLFSLALFEDSDGIFPGAIVRSQGQQLTIPVGDALLGRILSPRGQTLDAGGPLRNCELRSIAAKPPPSSGRPPIDTILSTGVRAIDGFCTLGKGQRIGIFASAGLGKSTLLSTIARNASVDVIVVALVGERGREVQEFVDETLGPQGLSRSVVVVATSDDSSLLRQTAPYTATTIAEYFRDQGKDVLLIVDSLTRMARALRETGLAAGELPVRHGYTNSVYTQLPKLVERAGRSRIGSITALYTVLTNQEEDVDPLADEVKSLLDGHIYLRKEIADLAIYPAIDISQSMSRLFSRLHAAGYCAAARIVTHAMARFLKDRHIPALGGIPDSELQRILDHQTELFGAVRQSDGTPSALHETDTYVRSLAERLKG